MTTRPAAPNDTAPGAVPSAPATAARPLQRLAQVDSPIIPTVAALARSHPGTLSLGQGVVRFGPPVSLEAALAPLARQPALHLYQAVEGIPELQQALRAKLQQFNGIPADTLAQMALIVTAGSNMAFLQALLATTDPGDEVILPVPYYFNQEMAIRMVGARPVMVPTDADHQLDVEAISRAITPATRVIVTISPNNPSGAVYREADLRAVQALCAQRGLLHFSDEAYELFCHDGAKHISPASFSGSAEHTFSFHSFSKGYGMASWRMGYCLYPARFRDAMHKIQDTNLICAPVASQYLALAALQAGPASVAPHIEELGRVRTAAIAQLQTLEGLATFSATQGAFYILLRLPPIDDPMAFNRSLVEAHRVACIPGFAFGLDPALGNYQRISYGALAPDDVATGLQRLIDGCRAYYRQNPARGR